MFGENKMSYRIRENGKKRSVFDKCFEIEKQLKQILPNLERGMLCKALAKCRLYYEGNLYYGRRTSNPDEKKKRKKKELTETEMAIYQFLLQNGYNPSTIYRWFLATRLPDDIKERLDHNQIPIRKAMIIAKNRKRVRESNISFRMLEEMRTVVRGL